MARLFTTRFLLTAVVSTAVLAVGSGMQAAGTTAEESPGVAAQKDVLFLGPRGAVVIHVRCRFDPVESDRSRQLLATALFKLLDANHDGRLDADEAPGIPAYGLFGKTQRAGDEWPRLDSAPGDGAISVDELAAHITAATPVRIQLKAAVSARAFILDLRRRLDSDRDGLILSKELRAASETLRICDFDDDGTFSLVELEALSQSAALEPEAASPLSALLPFVPLDIVSNDTIAELISKTYPATTSLLHGSLEADGDGTVRSIDVQEYLHSIQSGFQLTADFNGRDSAQLRWIATAEAERNEAPQESGIRRRLAVQIGDDNLELSWPKTQMLVDVLRRLRAPQFRIADRNRNQNIEETEFPDVDLPDQKFSDVDYDRNGQITEPELEVFVQQQLLLSQFTVAVTVGRKAKSLFEQLDDDQDRRLSPRELLGGTGGGSLVPAITDAEPGPPDSSDKYDLSFVLNTPRLTSQQIGDKTSRRGSAAGQKPRVAAPTEGPLWFRKMDRNQDGDLSWREFLGPSDIFARLDANGDTLVDAEEAAAAPPTSPVGAR